MLRVVKAVDKANGYVFGDTEERNLAALMSCAVGAEFEYEKIANVQGKYMNDRTTGANGSKPANDDDEDDTIERSPFDMLD